MYAALGIHPHDADSADAQRLDELRELLAHDRAVAVGETGLDHYRDYAPRPAQERLFEGHLALAEELGLPVVIHSRAAARETADALSGFGGDVILHCFSEPELLDVALERGYYVSFAGNVTYPKATELREAAQRVPADRILAETDSPFLAPQQVARPAERAGVPRRHDGSARGGSRRRRRGARSRGRREREPRVRDRMNADVSPKRALGQHFLVDPNILRVIGRLAKLDEDGRRARDRTGPRRADDVPCRSGTACSRRRGRRVSRADAPRRARRALERRASYSAMPRRLDASKLRPVTTKLVSNLPYNVAATVVVDSLETMPSIQLWCVMVQKEVGERFFAEPGTKAYGAVSVLVQLAAIRTGTHAVSRTVFRPRPRVDSMLVAFTRAPRLPHYDRVKEVVQAAFAHRRKTLPNSLALSGLAGRDEAAAALAALGHEATARAENLGPEEFARLAELL